MVTVHATGTMGGMETPKNIVRGRETPASFSDTGPESLRDIAVVWARRAQELIGAEVRRLGDPKLNVKMKSSPVDPVTVVDTAVERLLTSLIEKERPGDGIVGEEGADRASSTGVRWVIDPIDGTVNFLYGIPMFAVSIAAVVEDEPVAGVVLNVATGELFSGARGAGAHLTGPDGVTRELQCSTVAATGQALVATGFSYDSAFRQRQAELLRCILPEVRDIRRMGSAALDLCQVAAGRVDAYYEHALNGWDYAAGMIIAEEAGVRVVAPPIDSRSTDRELIWAAGVALAEEFRSLLERGARVSRLQ